MKDPTLELIPTETLKRNKQFSSIALLMVWCGASIAIAAAYYRFSIDGALPKDTFVFAILALLASIPVYLERKKTIASLENRNK